MGIPLDSKESAYSVGDAFLILRKGKSPGEGIGYPFQYSWASMVAQMTNNLSAMLKT